KGERVLVLAREAAGFGDALAAQAHVAMAVRIHEAVAEVRVLERLLAQLETRARAAHEIRRVRHRLHAARDDETSLARADLGRREHHALQSRAADLVDRRAGNALRDARAERRLTRGCLPDPGLEDVAHEDLVDVVWADAGTLERALDRDRAELRCGQRREAAEIRADGRASCSEDEHVGHDMPSSSR